MENLTIEEKKAILKIQKVLVVIANGDTCFFNYVLFVNKMKLLKANGRDIKNREKYILTEKGNQMLNITIN